VATGTFNDEINLKKTAFCITNRCTLNCKLCIAYIPYLKNKRDITPDESQKILKNYFSIVDSVNVFTISGGEPLLHRELPELLKAVYRYKPQIKSSIDFVSNATMPISEKVLELFCKHREYTRVVISNYGELSRKLNDIIAVLNENGINFIVHKYSGGGG